jgi:ADP-ribose pyrophosphatase YjhB (NUDIX family)
MGVTVGTEVGGKLIAVRTLVIQDQQVLLVGHKSTKTGKIWWMAPGGLVHAREPALEAAVREVREETGLDVEIDRLTYWLEWIWERSHCLELYFLGNLTGGQLAIGNDPELPEDRQIIFDARFVDTSELGDYPLYPKVFRTLLAEHLSLGFPEGATYLGISQPDLPR